MIYKFNGGRGAILCEECGVILAEGEEINDIISISSDEEKTNDILTYNINNVEYFCCELCRCEYYKKRMERSKIIK